MTLSVRSKPKVMERRKEENIGNIILRYLRQEQLETPLNEHRLIGAWGEVAGEAVEKQTQNLRIYNQTLYVTLRSAALRTELLMRRTELVKQLNDKVGAHIISNIAFA